MKDCLEKRACELAVYMIETGATVRATARHFGISKSTVHKDLTQRLESCNRGLYLQVRQILEVNKRERHIRGGMATRRKYEKRLYAAARKRGAGAPLLRRAGPLQVVRGLDGAFLRVPAPAGIAAGGIGDDPLLAVHCFHLRF